MNMTSRENVSKMDERIDKLADQLSTIVEIVSKKVFTPAPVKAVEETCVTCGGAHSWVEMKAITTRSGVAYEGPSIPTNPSPKKDIECKDSYDSNLDELTFLVTPLSDSNKDECLAPGDALKKYTSP
ncbi:hypothetical protein Tco_0024487 [Tanacetum coccineum]